METPTVPEIKIIPRQIQPEPLPPLAPGIQTSEFILSIVIVALAVAGVVSGKVPPGYSVLLTGLIGTAYPVLRNSLKQHRLNLAADLLDTALSNQHIVAAPIVRGAVTTDEPPAAPEALSFGK